MLRFWIHHDYLSLLSCLIDDRGNELLCDNSLGVIRDDDGIGFRQPFHYKGEQLLFDLWVRMHPLLIIDTKKLLGSSHDAHFHRGGLILLNHQPSDLHILILKHTKKKAPSLVIPRDADHRDLRAKRRSVHGDIRGASCG